jgi:hypothetical protein
MKLLRTIILSRMKLSWGLFVAKVAIRQGTQTPRSKKISSSITVWHAHIAPQAMRVPDSFRNNSDPVGFMALRRVYSRLATTMV